MNNIINENYKFNIQISERGYSNKSEIDYKRMRFHPENISLNDLSFYIQKGYSYCNNFNGKRKPENFIDTSIISFDIDDNPQTMNEFVSTLAYQPSLYYTTTSNGVGHLDKNGNPKSEYNNCFRLVYCFDTPVDGVNNYCHLFHYLLNILSLDLRDDCTKSCNQLLNGNGTGNCEIHVTNVVYSLPFEPSTPNNNVTSTKVSKETKYNNNNIYLNCNDTFIKDFNTLKRNEFIWKYADEYGINVPFQSNYIQVDERYSIAPVEFYKLPRKEGWNWETNEPIIDYWKKGEKRHKKLFIAGQVFKQLIPDVTFEMMIWLLTREANSYYDNSDGKFTNYYLIEVAKSVMNREMIIDKGVKHSKYKVDKSYCKRIGKTARQVAPTIGKEIRYNAIDEYFCPEKTDKENVEILSKNGIKVSIPTLKRYRKERGISKYTKSK